MKNTFILLTLALFFSLNLTGCSLFSSGGDEKETATVAEDQELAAETSEFASDDFEAGDDKDAYFDPEAIAKDDGGFDSQDMATQDVEVEDSFGEDNYPDDDYSTGGSGTGEVAAVEDSAVEVDDNSFGSWDSESVAVDEGGSLPDTAMSDNQEEDLFGQESDPVIDTPIFSDAFSGSMDPAPISDAPQLIPVKKMKSAAYSVGSSNINRLYVVRPKDTMESIAQKILGSDRSAELYSYNPHFQGKALKVGDKIYYPSPSNQNDQVMMTYYEDNSVSPQYYTSQDGDDLRKISKQLLGHKRSWMEIYATNDNVDSKDRLPAGLQIRYWPEDGAVPMPIAKASKPTPAISEPESENESIAMNEPEMAEPEEVKMDEPPQEVAQADELIPADDNTGNEDFNPPPVAAAINEPPRPMAPPPPPPAPRPNFNKPADMPTAVNGETPLSGLGEDSTIMAALGGLLILAFIIMLIFIRRSRAKRVNFSQTQV